MQTPVQITFHQLDASPDVETRIQEKVAKLEQFYNGIISCRVVVEPSAHTTSQTIFSVRFELNLPGNKTIIGGGSGTKNDGFDNMHTAINAAFEAAKRQLQDHAEKERLHNTASLGTMPAG